MSATATATPLHRALGFYEASNGKKAVMAMTGVILFGYVVGHLVGNLQVFAGEARINRYAEFLHSMGPALWGVRVFLGATVVLHIVASTQLWLLNRSARPVSYHRKSDVPSAYAARTMKWGGPIVGAFITFHILHLTVGNVMPLATLPGGGYDVYHNLINGFRIWYVSAAYIVGVGLLGMHLYHGLWSMFQSVGFNHPRYTPRLQVFSKIAAVVITAGYISIPVSVMTGIVQ
jgi:succinate dehydrogenase / fumarate reductase, cytochrome b subunit